MDSELSIVDRPDPEHPSRGRYVLLRGDEELGVAEYERADGVVTFVHTEVDTERRERGLGSRLVAGALAAERSGTTDRVAATCPFVVSFLASHPEYEDLQTR